MAGVLAGSCLEISAPLNACHTPTAQLTSHTAFPLHPDCTNLTSGCRTVLKVKEKARFAG